eukprot:CCRYP_000195-RA/>CCRYP_000195-RA protein AED:0.33 eAED:0.33 QI:256/1/1/1/1/1/4/276/231
MVQEISCIMTRYAPLLDNDHQATTLPSTTSSAAPSKMSTMLASLKESANKASTSFRSGLGLPPAESVDSAENSDGNSTMMDEMSEYCPKLTFQQRVVGFATCFTLGYLMSFMSFRLIIKLVEGNPAPFVFLYSSGNLLSLMSSMFLSGPQKQFKYMFDEKRKMTSIVYLTSLGTSITVCFIPMPTGAKIGILVLLLLLQMSASLWYTLSYIPYGRATATKMLRSAFAMDGE